MAKFELPPAGALRPNNAVDPFVFYYRPLIGRVFAARLDTGLGLLHRRFRRLCEVGYGSGLLMPTLARLTDELYGVDLEREPDGLRDALARLGVTPHTLVQSDVRRLPFADGFFDGVVAFSIFEHLKQPELVEAAREMQRVLEPGGHLLIGCPAVHKAMNAAFAAIGFSGIDEHHFSSIADVLDALSPYFTVAERASWPRLLTHAPLGWAPYSSVLLVRRP
jgi:ubiquinone/menaquinone biosynthesis C-methylase UbiE